LLQGLRDIGSQSGRYGRRGLEGLL